METKKITQEMRDALRKPLSVTALKAITTKPHLSSINPIYVIERLNDVFGVGSFNLKSELCAPISSEQKTSAKGRLYTEFTSLIKVTLTIQEYGIHLECIAGSTNEDEGDAAKGGISDCINKIASWLEIGIDIYKGNQSHNKQLPQEPKSNIVQEHFDSIPSDVAYQERVAETINWILKNDKISVKNAAFDMLLAIWKNQKPSYDKKNLSGKWETINKFILKEIK